VESESGQHSRNILQDKRRDSNQIARDFHEKEKKEFANKRNQEKQINKGLPDYFDACIKRCQILLNNNHIDPETYPLPVLYYYSDICINQNRQETLESHILDTSYQAIVNSSDENHHKKAVHNYNKIIEKYNG
jgi:hypothetical protein